MKSILNIFKRQPAPEPLPVTPPKKTRFWARNEDGSRYVTGITVAQLRVELERFKDTDEVLMAVCPKKYWNGGGLMGALKELEHGCDGQIWLKALVIDPSLE